MIKEIKKIRFMLDKEQRNSLLILSLLLVIGMFLEIIGLGVILPIITFILDFEIFASNELISEYFGNIIRQYEYNTIAQVMLLGLIIIYAVKTFFLAFLTYRQSIILENLYAYLSINLFKRYIVQPYKYHLNRDFPAMLKNLQIEVYNLVTYCRAILTIFVETSLSIAVVGTILFIEPIGALLVGILFIFLGSIYYTITKRKLIEWGEKRTSLDKHLSKISLESLSGIKDIKLFSREKNFMGLFNQMTYKKTKIASYHETVSQLPRFYLELVTVIALVFFIVFMIYIGQSKLVMISTIGVFVAATFRMIPSVNRVIGSLQTIKYYKSSVDLIYQEFNNLFIPANEFNNEDKIRFKREIILKNIEFRYNSNQKIILNNVSLKIKKGQTIGIIGKSGSGKSTIVDIINGLLKPSYGKIIVDGSIINEKDKEWQKNIGNVGQDIYLIDDSIKRNIGFGLNDSQIDEKRIRNVLKAAQLFDFVNELKNRADTIVGERGIQLSGGQRQRIGIARALYHDPEVLIFDEATASLDNKTEKEVMKSIYRLSEDKTILIVAHRLSTLTDCDEVYEIIDGKINKKEKKWKSTILQ